MTTLRNVLSSHRFFNGFSQTINVTARDHDFGDSVPNNMSVYQLLHSGQ